MTASDPSQLPEGLLASIDASSPPRVLLIRHADRPAIAPGDSGHDVALTPIGRSRSKRLGEYLRGESRWAVSSPLLRCRETAELMGASPVPSTLLGAPGPFVEDRERGGEVFGAHGTPAVVRGFIGGRDWGCMNPLPEGSRALVGWLRQLIDAREGNGIAVSHDAIVMPVVAWITGHDFAEDWLAPLDGLVLSTEGAVWRGRTFEVPP